MNGGPIALVRDGDVISIDAERNTLDVLISAEEMERRREARVAPEPKFKRGTLGRYVKTVSDATKGCVTDGDD